MYHGDRENTMVYTSRALDALHVGGEKAKGVRPRHRLAPYIARQEVAVARKDARLVAQSAVSRASFARYREPSDDLLHFTSLPLRVLRPRGRRQRS